MVIIGKFYEHVFSFLHLYYISLFCSDACLFACLILFKNSTLFDCLCKRKKLKVNVNENNVMVFESSKSEVVEFICPFRVRVEYLKECEMGLNGERMEEDTRTLPS